MRSRARSLAVLSLLLVSGLASPRAEATQPPVSSSFFGITVPTSVTKWPVPVPFGTAGKTASGSVSAGTYWAALEPSNGTFNWTPMDNLIAAARAAGVNTTFYTFFETPQWASSNSTQPCAATQNTGIHGCAAPPSNVHDWESFVTALVTRYKEEIQYYELWNEPNVPSEFSGSVQQMLAMAQTAYPIIKSIDPSAFVLAPGVSVAGIEASAPGCPSSQCWLDEYLQAGGGQYADGVAFHGKTCTSDRPVCVQEGISCPTTELESCEGTAMTAQVDDVRSLMAANGLSDKPVVDTEGGYSDEVGQKGLWGSADQQAAFVSRFFIVQASEGLRVAVYFSWLLNAAQGLMGFGTTSAAASNDQAYAQTRVWLLGAAFDCPCSLAGGVWQCDLTGPQGGEEAIAFADTNSSASSYAPSSLFTEYQDLTGATHKIAPGGSIPIDEKPVLLEGPLTQTSSTSSSSSTSVVPEFPTAALVPTALACLAVAALLSRSAVGGKGTLPKVDCLQLLSSALLLHLLGTRSR